MDYIEQMMEEAGVNGEIISCDKNCPNYKFNTACYSDDKGNIPCPVRYPDFAAEKQLELIKLIAADCILEVNTFIRNHKLEYLLFAHSGKSVTNKGFCQALTQLTTKLMKAGKMDKSKVKEILEDAR